MPRRTALAIGSTLVGVSLATAIVAWAGVSESLAALDRIGLFGCAQYAAVCALVLFVQGLGWWILLRAEGARAGPLLVAEAMLMGHALGYITPSAYLGGEPIRAWFVARELGIPVRRAFASVLLHKFQELSGFLVFVLIGTWVVVAAYRESFAPWITVSLVAFALAATAFFCVFLWSFARRRALLSGLFAGLARRRGNERWARVHIVCRDVEDHVHAALTARLPSTLVAHALTASTLGLVFLKPAILLALAGSPPFGFAEMSVFFVTTQVLMAFQPTPGGLGVNEGGFVGVYSLLGVRPPEALAFMAVVRLTDALLVGAGLLLVARLGWRSVAEAMGAGGATLPTAPDRSVE